MPRRTRWEDVRQAAITLFAQNGYTGASLAQMAKQSRISKPGIYYHVRDKEELLFRICESTMLEHLAVTRAAAAASVDDPVAKLRAVICAHGRHYFDHWAEHRVLFGQMRYLSAPARQVIVRLERQYLHLVRGIIREGQQRGEFRPVDPTVAAFSLFASLDTIDGWYQRRGRLKPAAIVAQIEELFLAGLMRSARRQRTQLERRERSASRKARRVRRSLVSI